MQHASLQAAQLPGKWANQQAWRILDTQWQGGSRFQAALAAWKRDEDRPRMLHYVALCGSLNQALEQRAAAESDFSKPWQMQSQSLAQGFNRITFEDGQVLLTLCVGTTQAMLLAHRFIADTVFLSNFQVDDWNEGTVRILVRSCQLGTDVVVEAEDSVDSARFALIQNQGFRGAKVKNGPLWVGQLRPDWQLKTSRRQFAAPVDKPSNCVVVGAGLAGASVAAAMARRGWQVQVLDLAEVPAAGTSSLPVGLMAPLPSQDDSVQSRCLTMGIKLTTWQAQKLLTQGDDWAPSGVMNCKPGAQPRWQPEGAWIKPTCLVRAWLNHPHIEFKGGVNVAKLEPIRPAEPDAPNQPTESTCSATEAWGLYDPAGQLVAKANLVILACAAACETFGSNHSTRLAGRMQSSKGQISWAMQAESLVPLEVGIEGDFSVKSPLTGADTTPSFLPIHPVNGQGHLLAQIPYDGGLAWFLGATYVTSAEVDPSVADHHAANFARLQNLCPQAAKGLRAQFEGSDIRAWQGMRYGCTDRMPVVGRLSDSAPPGLWCVTGFGSRGLSWSTLCAELLAARVSGEPLPIEGRLADCMDSQRFGN